MQLHKWGGVEMSECFCLMFVVLSALAGSSTSCRLIVVSSLSLEHRVLLLVLLEGSLSFLEALLLLSEERLELVVEGLEDDLVVGDGGVVDDLRGEAALADEGDEDVVDGLEGVAHEGHVEADVDDRGEASVVCGDDLLDALELPGDVGDVDVDGNALAEGLEDKA